MLLYIMMIIMMMSNDQLLYWAVFRVGREQVFGSGGGQVFRVDRAGGGGGTGHGSGSVGGMHVFRVGCVGEGCVVPRLSLPVPPPC